MIRLDIKPLSVNEVWAGRRFKTPKYTKYESDMLQILPDIKIPKGEIQVFYEFGFSSASSDIDNPVKPLQDILQKRYNFDDKRIVKMTVTKKKVKKGFEYILFDII